MEAWGRALEGLPLLLLVVYFFRDTMRRVLAPEVGIFVLIVLVIGGLRWMQVARLVRATCLSLKERVRSGRASATMPFGISIRNLQRMLLRGEACRCVAESAIPDRSASTGK